MKEIVETRRLWTPAPRCVARQVLVLFCLPLAGCASTSARDPTPASSASWNAVVELPRGSEVTISIDCVASDHEACELARCQIGSDNQAPKVLVGTHIEADADSILIRPEQQISTVLSLPKEIVVTVDVEERDSRITGTLIGIAIGVGSCAVVGLFTEEDFTKGGRVLLTGVCAGGGAALGYVSDHYTGQPYRRRIFQRRSSALRSF